MQEFWNVWVNKWNITPVMEKDFLHFIIADRSKLRRQEGERKEWYKNKRNENKAKWELKKEIDA